MTNSTLRGSGVDVGNTVLVLGVVCWLGVDVLHATSRVERNTISHRSFLQLESRFTVIELVKDPLEPLEAGNGARRQPELDMLQALARVAA